VSNIEHKDIGDIWKPLGTFTVAGVPTDPTVITTRVMDPTGALTTASYTAASLTTASTPLARSTATTTLGSFVLSHSLNLAGHWYARFEGTGAATAAEDFEVIVDPSPFYASGGVSTRALVSLGETKDWLARIQVNTNDDGKIVSAINGCSEEFMRVSGREFKPDTAGSVQRSFDLYGATTVQIDDLQTVSSASTSATITSFETGAVSRTLAMTDFDAMPRNRAPWQPITALKFRQLTATALGTGYVLNITGYWGFPSIPENVKEAVKDAVAFNLDRDVEHFRQDLGIGATGEAGQTVFIGQAPPTVYSLPPTAWKVAQDYRRKLVM
jgi:hypothetical protein